MNPYPTAIIAEGPNSYKVRFQTETGEIESGVTVEDAGLGAGIFLLVGDSDFLDITEGDPAADCLRESIFALHQARHFKYATQETKPTVDITDLNSGADAPKRASA
jgi:hypothetical protein